MTDRTHVLSLFEGDLFRFQPEGTVYRIVIERDEKGKAGRYLCEPADKSRQVSSMAAVVEYLGCWVYRVEGPEGDES